MINYVIYFCLRKSWASGTLSAVAWKRHQRNGKKQVSAILTNQPIDYIAYTSKLHSKYVQAWKYMGIDGLVTNWTQTFSCQHSLGI